MIKKEMRFIPQMEPWFGNEEAAALNEYMLGDGWVTEFKKTEEFENRIADFVGVKHCVAVNNGTVSLTLAAIASGIGSGDDVIIPNYTMVASPNSVKMIGANPIFVDIELDSLCLDIELTRDAITPKTKAIILVSANGRYPKHGIEKFSELCKEKGLVLIEDSAQSLGSFYPDGSHIGSAGLIGSFSFSSPKIISTGQGGALVTNDDDIAYKLRRLKDFGRSRGGIDFHDSIGYNFKFTDIQAVIGIEQMKKLQWRIERKKEIFRLYESNLNSLKEVAFFQTDLQKTSPWFIDSLVENRTDLIKHLKSKNIGTRLMYQPLNKQKAYNLPGHFPCSDKIGESGLWLPSASQLENEEVNIICRHIVDFYQ